MNFSDDEGQYNPGSDDSGQWNGDVSGDNDQAGQWDGDVGGENDQAGQWNGDVGEGGGDSGEAVEIEASNDVQAGSQEEQGHGQADGTVEIPEVPNIPEGGLPGMQCPNEGYFPEPNDNNKFIRCDGPGGQAFTMDCPTNLVWHDELKLCNYP